MTGRRPGFTLIEMLVVIVILAILVSLVAVAVGGVQKSSKVSATETFLAQVVAALEQYKTRWGDYPPTSFAEIGGRAPNSVNEGVETLVACLASKRRGNPFMVDEGRLANVDADKTDKNLTDWYFGDTALREYTDYFGFVISYVHHRNFAAPKADSMRYRVSEGDKEQQVGVERSGATATFLNVGKFQLRSPGPDGKFGTQDDIWPAGN